MSFPRFSVPGVSRGNWPVRGTTAEPDRNGDDLPFCDFLGGWRVKKAPYEIRGLCYAACEEGPACDSTFVVAIAIVNRVYMIMNKVPCSMPYSRYLSARIEFCNLGIHATGGARSRPRADFSPGPSGKMS